jgi:hypothetical protein
MSRRSLSSRDDVDHWTEQVKTIFAEQEEKKQQQQKQQQQQQLLSAAYVYPNTPLAAAIASMGCDLTNVQFSIN